jgi:hypothetical protein
MRANRFETRDEGRLSTAPLVAAVLAMDPGRGWLPGASRAESEAFLRAVEDEAPAGPSFR